MSSLKTSCLINGKTLDTIVERSVYLQGFFLILGICSGSAVHVQGLHFVKMNVNEDLRTLSSNTNNSTLRKSWKIHLKFSKDDTNFLVPEETSTSSVVFQIFKGVPLFRIWMTCDRNILRSSLQRNTNSNQEKMSTVKTL